MNDPNCFEDIQKQPLTWGICQTILMGYDCFSLYNDISNLHIIYMCLTIILVSTMTCLICIPFICVSESTSYIFRNFLQ